MIDWEIIIALALAGSLSLWIFVVPEDELHGAVAGMKDLGGTTYYAGRENSTFGLRGGGFLLHEGLQRGMAWPDFTCLVWLLDKDTKL